METLVVVEQHRNQYYSSRGKVNNSAWFGSSPSRGFRDINCRTFESRTGLLPSPFKGFGSLVSNPGLFIGSNGGKLKCEDGKPLKKNVNSSPIYINVKGCGDKKERLMRDSFSLSELWVGPAYSNLPPPSSLPIPKFSMKPIRTVSLELNVLESNLSLQPMAKSAPASPTREFLGGSGSLLCDDDSATKTLRRILNLDTVDD